jgi:hypothetical protein
MHQALLPVFLLSQVIGQTNSPTNTQLSLCLRPDEVESGSAAVSRAIAHMTGGQVSAHAPSACVFGFFAHAAGLKAVERAWWTEFWHAFLELHPEAIPLEFLPSPPKPLLDARFASMHCPSPRAMTAAIAATRMFISADTGPMHLASSTPVPTVALFRASNPALYGPLKDRDAAINITESTPQLVARHCQRLWRASLTESASDPGRDRRQALLQVGRSVQPRTSHSVASYGIRFDLDDTQPQTWRSAP